MKLDLILILATLALAGGGELDAQPGMAFARRDRHRQLQGEGANLFEEIAVTLYGQEAEPGDGDYRLPPELRWLEGRPRGARGDGGGSDVSDVQAIQTSYSDPANGNVVLLIWSESVPNPAAGITISLDGARIATVDGLPAEQLPGQNTRFITTLSAGAHTFLVEAQDGSFGETSINVLGAQPFADVKDIRCEQGPVNDNQTCQVIVSWTNLPPFPTSFKILLNDNVLGDVPGTIQRLTLRDAPAGENCFTVIGFLDNQEGTYRGGLVRVCCTVTCEDLPCNPPAGLSLWQVAYGDQGILEVRWVNGESTYSGVNGYVNAQRVGSLSGNAQGALISPLPPGDYTIGIQGNCGTDGLSTFTEAAIAMRAETPHPTPASGAIVCEFNAAAGSTTATWTNATPSTMIDVYLAPGGNLNNLSFRRTIRGDSTTVTEAGTAQDDLIVLQFFTVVDAQCYGSELLSCGSGPPPGNQFIRGVCNGVVSDPTNPFPAVTSAVFLFNFLFLQGPSPPCVEACNVNGEGSVNITDGVYLLNFLFLQGPPPANWTDANGDGSADATCEAADAAKCAAAHGFCPR
jgi:hypothetical protein